MSAELLKRVRDFTAVELIGKEDHFDGPPEQPTAEASRLVAAGLANWWVPQHYGGMGLSLQDSVDVVSELAYGDAGFAFGAFLPVLGSLMLQHFGDEELARPALESLAAEGSRIALLASEEEAGSELVRTATTFRAEGDGLVLTGEKYFATNTDAADMLLVLARSSDDDTDFAVIAVPRDTPGVEIVKRWDLLGVRGTGTYRVRLNDCAVPAANRLRGSGLRILEASLNASRILIAACAVGISRRIRDLSMDYAAAKRIRSAPLTENAVFAGKLGQMEMQIDVMRNQCRAAAAEFDGHLAAAANGGPGLLRVGTLRSALAAKLFCGQTGWHVASAGSELFGGLGYTQDHPIGKLVRDMRFVAIIEGGEDIMRDMLYARYVLSARKRR
ncbi:acyl-CoA/acyl-ACP dehydrogenase [Streptomyces sp. ACA25]|uniref:acyl-CoA dehydrogenase family protein n=1 Tax=Streptomyces sp. ACA25 TaxID=3022596 RepID=UPI002306F5E0|nr:acyl-CoA dehydrogenase family protein [Streptomyces sp. ACA25]MDB1087004.1 acyl-CoA/acyl-ACP dehydrogenase [Streptomyces sp. ACA25]